MQVRYVAARGGQSRGHEGRNQPQLDLLALSPQS